jgi:hypothetical protein
MQEELRDSLTIAQYTSLRDEIVQRVQARQQMWSSLLVIAGAFLSIGSQSGLSPWIAPLYPLITLCLAANWAHNDQRITQLVTYIRQEVEVPGVFSGWETYRSKTFRKRASPLRWRHPQSLLIGLHALSAQSVFAITQGLATLIGLARLAQGGRPALVILALVIDVAASITTWHLLRDQPLQQDTQD